MQERENPFKLEKNHKELVQRLERERSEPKLKKKIDNNDIPYFEKLYKHTNKVKKYGIIQMFDKETEKIVRERNEILAREINIDYLHGRKKLPALTSQNLEQNKELLKKSYKIKNILKEKRDTIAEFVQKKREIFLANMNINIKKEETNRLEDFIKNEEESLKARELDIKNDWDLLKNFMNNVKEEADLAQKKTEEEAKRKEKKTHKIYNLQVDIDKIKISLAKGYEELKNLKCYKEFVDNLGKRYASNKPCEEKSNPKDHNGGKKNLNENDDQNFFITNKENTNTLNELNEIKEENELNNDESFTIPFNNGKQVLELLSQIEEKNLYYIQNTHESEEELEKKRKVLKELTEKYEANIRENNERNKLIEKAKEQAVKKHQKLQNLKTIDSNKLEISDGQNIDMVKVGNKILEIYKEIVNKESKTKTADSKEMHSMLKSIEATLDNLINVRKEFSNGDEKKQKFLNNIEKTIKDKEKNKTREEEKLKKEKLLKVQQELKKVKEIKAMENLQKKKGRRPMTKKVLAEDKVEENIEVNDTENDEEKYFRESFELGFDVAAVATQTSVSPLKNEKTKKKKKVISEQNTN